MHVQHPVRTHRSGQPPPKSWYVVRDRVYSMQIAFVSLRDGFRCHGFRGWPSSLQSTNHSADSSHHHQLVYVYWSALACTSTSICRIDGVLSITYGTRGIENPLRRQLLEQCLSRAYLLTVRTVCSFTVYAIC